MNTKEILITFCGEAFNLGRNQKNKQKLKQSELIKTILYCHKNAYFPLIWEAYKAGLYARDHED